MDVVAAVPGTGAGVTEAKFGAKLCDARRSKMAAIIACCCLTMASISCGMAGVGGPGWKANLKRGRGSLDPDWLGGLRFEHRLLILTETEWVGGGNLARLRCCCEWCW